MKGFLCVRRILKVNQSCHRKNGYDNMFPTLNPHRGMWFHVVSWATKYKFFFKGWNPEQNSQRWNEVRRPVKFNWFGAKMNHQPRNFRQTLSTCQTAAGSMCYYRCLQSRVKTFRSKTSASKDNDWKCRRMAVTAPREIYVALLEQSK